jgi:hypothetical protein
MVAYYNEYGEKRQYTRSDSLAAGAGRALYTIPNIDAIAQVLFCWTVFQKKANA